jgi:UDP-N-acetylglucosamine 2-epimerase (non-hydrolysing)
MKIPHPIPPNTIPGKPFTITMLHRKETLYNEKRLHAGIKIIEQIAEKFPTLFIVSQKTKHTLEKTGIYEKLKENQNIILQNPYDYHTFVKLLKTCEFIAADSGGIQEEAYALNKPYLILRRKTERTEGLGETCLLSKLDPKTTKHFIENYHQYQRVAKKDSTSASKTIVEQIDQLVLSGQGLPYL